MVSCKRSPLKGDPGGSPEEYPVQAGALPGVAVPPGPGEDAVRGAPGVVQLPRGPHAGRGP